jgi:hypothetical protein
MDRESDHGLTRVLKMKQGTRDKDAGDRSFLQQLIKADEAGDPIAGA